MGKMDLRQDALTRLGAFVLLGHFRGDFSGRDQLAGDLMVTDADGGGGRLTLADALSYIATVGVSTLVEITDSPFADVLTDLDEPDVFLIPPPTTVPWAEAEALIEAIPSGEGVGEASRWMDLPGAVNGTFAIGVSAFQEFENRTGKSAVSLLEALIVPWFLVSGGRSTREGPEMRLKVDAYRCIGAGRCVWVAPVVFEQDEDGIVVLLDATPPADLAGEVAEAVRMCPVEAIELNGVSDAE